MFELLNKSYPGSIKVNDNPPVYVCENFLNDNEIEAIITAGNPHLNRALVASTPEGAISKLRTNRNCGIAHDTNPEIAAICQRLTELISIPLEHAEPIQLVHYNPGQEYVAHLDGWKTDSNMGQNSIAVGGQRILTCLIYLNNVEAGGETTFPNLNLTIRPKKGRLVIFHNCQADSIEPHPDSLHAALPVLKGEKWACNFWVRERAFITEQQALLNKA